MNGREDRKRTVKGKEETIGEKNWDEYDDSALYTTCYCERT